MIEYMFTVPNLSVFAQSGHGLTERTKSRGLNAAFDSHLRPLSG